MKIIVHDCIIDQPHTGSENTYWYKGNEIRIFINHIISYRPVEIFLKKKHKNQKAASRLKTIIGDDYFLFESPAEIDNLIKIATNTNQT